MLTYFSSSAQGTGGSSNGDHISDRSQGLPLKVPASCYSGANPTHRMLSGLLRQVLPT